MTMLVELTPGSLMPRLVDALTRNGCEAERLAPGVCRVAHTRARDPEEARLELAFFLRAWELGNPGARANIVGA